MDAYKIAMKGNLLSAQGADVASANDMTLGTDGNFFDITGTTTINTITTMGVGTFVTLQFDGALQLTHSADLFLPTAGNITTVAGDIAVFYEYATGDWRCVSYTRADGSALKSFTSSAELAAALDDETGTGVAVFGTAPTLTAPCIKAVRAAASGMWDAGVFRAASPPAPGKAVCLPQTARKFLSARV